MPEGLHHLDTPTLMRIYREVLGWSLGYLASGDSTEMALPGGLVTPVSDEVLGALNIEQHPAIACRCVDFDAVTLPGPLGHAALTAFEGGPDTPSFTASAPNTVTLLVAPGSGPALATCDERLSVHAGSDSWLVIPPSPGTRWDTAPWVRGQVQPIALRRGEDLVPALRQGLRVRRVAKSRERFVPDGTSGSQTPRASEGLASRDEEGL